MVSDFCFVCGHLPGESRGQNRERSVIHCIGSACHDYGGKQFRHGIAGIIVSSDHPSGQRGSGTAQDGAVAAAVYTGVYHRLRPECGGSGKFRTCPQLCGLGLRTAGVHRQIILEAVKHIPEYTGPVVLMVMLLLVPMIWQAVKSTDYRFRYPGIVLALSFCLYATGYTPSLYSLGHAGLSRTLNAVKITYLLLLFLNEIYWIGWLRQLLEKRAEQTTGQLTIQKWAIRNGAAAWWFYVLIGVACLVIFRASSNQAGHYSSYGAYYYVHTGEAYNFHQEYLERVAILSGPEKMCSCRPISSARGFVHGRNLRGCGQ